MTQPNMVNWSSPVLAPDDPIPARMPGVFVIDGFYHHKPGRTMAGLWWAACGEPCFYWPNLREVRAYYVPCPHCPPEE